MAARRLHLEPRLVAAVLWAAVLMPAAARAEWLSAEPVWRSGPTDNTYGLALGDVDRDGDLDLVCANHGGRVALYLDVDGRFATTPAWTSQQPWSATAVALGDVDGDGDLDLVCGNDGHGGVLFRNVGGTFEPTPHWTSGTVDPTTCVALADVDLDGDLDLVCGNAGAPIRVYRGAGGTFEPAAAWSSGTIASTTSIALGDVDGDGDLDLVCGNYLEPVTLFLNRSSVPSGATVFDATPAWAAGTSATTRGVALGDVNGDGALDLVCGNYLERIRVFLNVSGTLESVPSDSLPTPERTYAVALGDVDADGDLDLVCGNGGEGSSLHVNGSGHFGPAAVWASLPHATLAIALGDVDSNGMLDVVCGNDGESSALYSNIGGPIRPAPSWASLPANTGSVALGDIDGDGDLDVVCGNYEQPVTLYRNAAGQPDAAPAWTSALVEETAAVALADVDGDGDLDLVVGNDGEPTRLYPGTNGTFAATPAWSTGRAEATTSVAVGDVDGDGRPDLVCGNYGGPNSLRLNHGGVLDTTRAWVSDSTHLTTDVALGDIDGDGDLDLVCGNYNQANVVYENVGGTFSARPVWHAGFSEATTSIALGDVNGDGRLDLVDGNNGGSNTLYLNAGGALATAPAWSSVGTAHTWAVALGDVDGDGDLDLFAGNAGQGSTLTLNDHGTLAADPSWTSIRADSTLGLALGDLDDDGDLDVVCGNYKDQASTVYSGLLAPPFRGDPLAPTHQLANTDSYVRSVRVDPAGRNHYRVRLTTVDVESDPLWIVPEYQFRGEPHWSPVRVPGAGAVLGPLTSSPAGVDHEFDWDVLRVPFDRRPVVLRIRVVSIPRRTAAIQHAAVFLENLAPLQVYRPALRTSVRSVRLLPVTVGDTAVATVTISNAGNAELNVTRLGLPSSTLRSTVDPPISIAPNGRVDVGLSFTPIMAESLDVRLLIDSDDPLIPSDTVAVQAAAIGLDVDTEALTTGDVATLGEALTVQVVPASGVRVERGLLHYRASGAAGFEHVELVHHGASWIGVVPGESMREGETRFYVEVENSGVLATDPPGAPDSSFRQPVAAPTSIAAVPRPLSGDVLDGVEVPVDVILPPGTDFLSGTIHFRQAGEVAYGSDTLSTHEVTGQPFAVIPGSMVGARGVEYWVEVQTRTRMLRVPALGGSGPPSVLRVSVQELEEPTSHPAGRYRLLAFPLDFGSGPSGGLETLLSDESEFGLYDPIRWRLFRYDPAQHANEEFSGATRAAFRPRPGHSFWLISRAEHRVDSAPIRALSTLGTASGREFPIALAPGWNQIGNPFAFPVAWSAVRRSAAIRDPVAFDASLGSVGDYAAAHPGVLAPFEGYFIENTAAVEETVWVPPVEVQAVPATANVAPSPDEWSLLLRARTSEAVDGSNVLGVRRGASDVEDALDERKPPMPPGAWVRVGFAHPDWGGALYRRDVRAPADGHAWEIELRSASAGEAVTLDLVADAELPADLAVAVIDREQSSVDDVRVPGGEPVERHVVSFGPARPYRLTLLAGTAAFVAAAGREGIVIPARVELDRAAPNPFAASTRIRFGLPREQRVTVEIFDVLGERLAAPLDGARRSAGYHSLLWSATRRDGRPVASGVYFLRLTTEDATISRRLVLIR